MKRKAQGDGFSGDRDGVRVVYDGRRGLRASVFLIAIVATGALAAFLLLRRAEPTAPAAAPEPRQRFAADTEPSRIRIPGRSDESEGVPREAAVRNEENRGPAWRTTVRRPPKAAVVRTSTERERAGDADEKRRPEIDARDYIAGLRESGETAGLAAFAPPGTRPPRPGVIVPPDYELPEGYARHYQTTDDGRQLAPVLVVAPGYEIVDDAGDPVALTDGRIVPPEHAPPGLSVEMLEVPSEHDTGEDAR